MYLAPKLKTITPVVLITREHSLNIFNTLFRYSSSVSSLPIPPQPNHVVYNMAGEVIIKSMLLQV
jgi:hypothetical protein